MKPVRLTRRGAEAIAKRLPRDAELDRLYQESAEAARDLQVALEAAPEGVVMADLPEWATFRQKAKAFSDAVVERL